MGSAAPWRDKTRVLCLYDCYSEHYGRLYSMPGGVMVEVEFADQIEGEFERIMCERRAIETLRRRNPAPKKWSLKSYLPEHGRRLF